MTSITVSRSISADAQTVFAAVAHPELYPKTSPGVQSIDFLTEQRTGAGTRFSELRLDKHKTVRMDFEVTEYKAPSHVRIVTEVHGTVWDTTYAIQADGPVTNVTLTMDARSTRVLPRFMIGLFKKKIQSSVAENLDAVKAWCEAQAS